MSKSGKNQYELALILQPDMDDAARDQQLDLIEKIIKQFKGEVNKREADGKKNLAFPIKKQSEGWYYYLHFNIPTDSVEKLDTKIKMEDQVIRHLILAKQQ